MTNEEKVKEAMSSEWILQHMEKYFTTEELEQFYDDMAREWDI